MKLIVPRNLQTASAHYINLHQRPPQKGITLMWGWKWGLVGRKPSLTSPEPLLMHDWPSFRWHVSLLARPSLIVSRLCPEMIYFRTHFPSPNPKHTLWHLLNMYAYYEEGLETHQSFVLLVRSLVFLPLPMNGVWKESILCAVSECWGWWLRKTQSVNSFVSKSWIRYT